MAKTPSIVLLKDTPLRELNGSTFITGYPGFGLVGYLTSKYVVTELHLEKIGFVKTKYMGEVTYYSKELGLIYPFELYYGRVNGKGILVLLNHTLPHERERTEYVETICKWLKEIGVSRSILVGGLDPSVKEKEDETYRWLPIAGFNIELDAPKLIDKYVIGPLALTMIFMDAYRIPSVVILSYTELYRPDPRASAVAVNVISKLLEIEIDASKLLEEASIIEAIEEKKELMKSMEKELSYSKRGYSIHV